MTTLLKLGGSAITRKEEPETVDEEALETAAADIGNARDADEVEDFVLVHGAGSFGHYRAAQHDLSRTDGTHDAAAITEVHNSMTALTEIVVGTLQEYGIEAVPVRPLSLAHRHEDGTLGLPSEGIEAMLAEEFVPVLHGDVIVNAGKGGTILSGDEIIVPLARSLSADRVGLCSTVPGVLDDDGEVVPEIHTYDEVAGVLGESAATDVTGGMAGKVRALLDLAVPAHIFDPSGLAAFLDGDSPGTVIRSRD